jgi:hypothetical protein
MNDIYTIRVEIWVRDLQEDGFSKFSDFSWGLDFAAGATLVFDTARAALEHIHNNPRVPGVPSCKYRFRVCKEQ